MLFSAYIDELPGGFSFSEKNIDIALWTQSLPGSQYSDEDIFSLLDLPGPFQGSGNMPDDSQSISSSMDHSTYMSQQGVRRTGPRQVQPARSQGNPIGDAFSGNVFSPSPQSEVQGGYGDVRQDVQQPLFQLSSAMSETTEGGYTPEFGNFPTGQGFHTQGQYEYLNQEFGTEGWTNAQAFTSKPFAVASVDATANSAQHTMRRSMQFNEQQRRQRPAYAQMRNARYIQTNTAHAGSPTTSHSSVHSQSQLNALRSQSLSRRTSGTQESFDPNAFMSPDSFELTSPQSTLLTVPETMFDSYQSLPNMAGSDMHQFDNRSIAASTVHEDVESGANQMSAQHISIEAEPKVARTHPLYQASPGADDLYHCPYEGKEGCTHKATKLKCNYDKYVDSHLRPFRCKVKACTELQFSSTACLLRHEREAHGMHGHGDKPYLCEYPECERAVPGNGFPRRWNLHDHMKRVHDHAGEPPIKSPSSGASAPQLKRQNSRKRKAESDEAPIDKRARPVSGAAMPPPQQQSRRVQQQIQKDQLQNKWNSQIEAMMQQLQTLNGPVNATTQLGSLNAGLAALQKIKQEFSDLG